MTPARHHAEWLSLVESSGPFLSMPVLLRVFPQGLDHRDPTRAAALRENYEDWLDRGRPLLHVHTAWIRHVLENLLEWPADFIAEGQAIPAGLEASQPHFGETLRPDLVLRRPLSGTTPGTADADTTPQLLVVTYPPGQDLEKPVAGKVWKASPATRMTELLHASGVPLGLVTNGEHWMVVYAPRGETSGFASWYADIWMQEPITLRAFHSLLCLRRFFGVAAGETLAALYAESAKDQQEVTDQLGRQVRRAVEMLVAAFDQIDAESNRTLLTSVPEKEVYDAALTVMMRLVFLFSAEERGLLLLGDPLFDQHYAVSTLRELLRERADQHGEEVLERRHDAWSRLLATFRAVHGGVQHEAMRLPAYGGSLFDPDRYPFLEGRETDTRWRETPSHPLPVNNRVVLHLLEALQLLRVRVPGGGPTEARRVSFRALDIEQIGHVYEGLLDHAARRATEITLGLDGKNEPEIPLSKLEELAGFDPNAAEPAQLSDERMVAEDRSIVEFPTRKVSYHDTPTAPAALIDFLKEETGRSANALESALGYGKPKTRGKAKADAPAASSILDLPSTIHDHSLLLACGQDPHLARRIRPFAGLLRTDDFGRLAVIRPGAVFVTAGTDRRSSGTHYTPKSLTEPVVKHTLDPLVYIGPAEGLPESEWKLKSPKEILSLKICDLAMGSGAFLVQVCRYLADRLCEAWEIAEKEHAGSILITPDGEFSVGSSAERLLPSDPAERVALARRYVADRCLYGVDINPMAVEMAKLSLWLITLQKDRPFTFLDHALKCGDSLLGVSDVKQIENFSLRVKAGETVQDTFATANLFRYIEDAAAKRRKLEDLPSNDHSQIETKLRLHTEAQAATARVKAIADCLIALELRGLDGKAYEEQRAEEAEKVQRLMQQDADAGQKSEMCGFKSELAAHAREQLCGRRPFHWAVEFPEVFARGGFDVFAGNPPFLGGRRISFRLGELYYRELQLLYPWAAGTTDLCVYFLRRACSLLRDNSVAGFVLSDIITQGDSRESGIVHLCANGFKIICGQSSRHWPGTAGVKIVDCHLFKGSWQARAIFDSVEVAEISSHFRPEEQRPDPFPLRENAGLSLSGHYLMGQGFLISPQEAASLIDQNPANSEVIFEYIKGDELNNDFKQDTGLKAINFGFRTLPEIEARYAEALEIVRQRVKPERDIVRDDASRERWWRYARPRPELEIVMGKSSRVILQPYTAKFVIPTFYQSRCVFAHPLVVVTDPTGFRFACLQSTIHTLWVWAYCSTNLSLIAYTANRVLETFPFPKSSDSLSQIGEKYFALRDALRMGGLSLNDTYNRFHDRGEKSADSARLRALHVEMDQALAAAYGWNDLDLGHGFHETKQGIRYTCSEPARREVLDRLLALNHQRYTEELAAGLHEKKSKKPATTKPATKRGRKTTVAALVEPQELGLDFGSPVTAKPKADAVFATTLVIGLLSEAQRQKTPLRMSRLKQAFDLITQPAMMENAAPNASRGAVKQWAAKWQSPVGPDWFIPTLKLLKGGTVKATNREDDPPMALVGKLVEPDSSDLKEGIRLAVEVVGHAPPVPLETMKTLIRERRAIFTTP